MLLGKGSTRLLVGAPSQHIWSCKHLNLGRSPSNRIVKDVSTAVLESTSEARVAGSASGASSIWPARDASAVSHLLSPSLRMLPHRIAALLARCPVLLSLTPEALQQRLGQLAAELEVSPASALHLSARRPAVLMQLPPGDVRAKTTAFAAVMGGMPYEQVAFVMVQQPALLELPPALFKELCDRLAVALDMAESAAMILMGRLRQLDLKHLISASPLTLGDQMADLRNLVVTRFSSRRSSDAARLAVRQPSLLFTSITDVEGVLDVLDVIFQSPPPARLLSIVMDHPGLLVLPPGRLKANFEELVSALCIDQETVVRLVATEPGLLRIDGARARAGMDFLMFNMFLPRKQALDMLVRQPQLLTYDPATLLSHMSSLAALLAVTHDVAVAVVQRCPQLLCAKPETLQDKLSAFAKEFGQPLMRGAALVLRHPVLLTFSRERLQAQREALAMALRLPPTELAQLVWRHPRLLLEDMELVRSKISDCSSLLGISPALVAPMVVKAPDMLDKDFRHWQTNVDTVASMLGLEMAQTRDTVRTHPRLLCVPADQLHYSASRLHDCLRRSPQWRQQLETATPKQINSLLLMGHRELEQLEYLTEYKLQGHQPLLDTSLFDRVRFSRKFPDFDKQSAREFRVRQHKIQRWINTQAGDLTDEQQQQQRQLQPSLSLPPERGRSDFYDRDATSATAEVDDLVAAVVGGWVKQEQAVQGEQVGEQISRMVGQRQQGGQMVGQGQQGGQNQQVVGQGQQVRGSVGQVPSELGRRAMDGPWRGREAVKMPGDGSRVGQTSSDRRPSLFGRDFNNRTNSSGSGSSGSGSNGGSSTSGSRMRISSEPAWRSSPEGNAIGASAGSSKAFAAANDSSSSSSSNYSSSSTGRTSVVRRQEPPPPRLDRIARSRDGGSSSSSDVAAEVDATADGVPDGNVPTGPLQGRQTGGVHARPVWGVTDTPSAATASTVETGAATASTGGTGADATLGETGETSESADES